MVNIYNGTNKFDISIADMISQFTGFEVFRADSYPESICMPCLEDAQNAFQIKQTYERCHQIFCQLREELIEKPHSEVSRKQDCCLAEHPSEQDFSTDVSGDGGTTEFPFKCPQCPKRCKLKCNLTKHMRIHSAERPFQCDHCPATFKDSSVLHKHTRIHTGERPFKCSLCPKAFSYSGSLRDHMLEHTGERPHQCPQCSSSFRWQKLLKIHMRIHTGERPYRCPHCSKAFAARTTLQTHIRTHTKKRPYKCKLCLRSFSISQSLRSHMKLHEELPVDYTRVDSGEESF